MPKTKPAKTTNGALTTLQPNAAGADIGAREIYVAVPPERDASPVRCFGTFTDQLRALVEWLRQCRIETLAMEATGVYWIPLAEILEEAGIAVCLVNPRHVSPTSATRSKNPLFSGVAVAQVAERQRRFFPKCV
jgi:hypothetical protein